MHFFCGCIDHLRFARKGGSAPQTAARSFPAVSTSVTQWMSHRDIVIFSLSCGPCRWTPAVVAVTYLFMYPSLRYTHSLALVNFFCMVSCECVGGVMLALLWALCLWLQPWIAVQQRLDYFFSIFIPVKRLDSDLLCGELKASVRLSLHTWKPTET